MIAQIFAIIQALLGAFGLWEAFLSYIDKVRLAEDEAKRQRRDGAIDDASKATTPEDAFNAQDGVVSNEP